MKVSVCLITYNHEQYIQQCLESILDQETNFDLEVVIGEDYSKDNTRFICQQYAERYPHLIRLVPADKNIGMIKNFHRNLKECDGKYVAFIEGDDYWTDKLKLQKQVDFLEVNTDYSSCFHNVLMKQERNGEDKEWVLHQSLKKERFNTEDVLGPWFIPSLSFVFRNYKDLDLPEWFFNCKYGDLPMMLLLSLRGDIKYINEVMGVYRLHDTGMTTRDIGYDKIILMIYIYESFNIHTNYKFKDTVRKSMIYEIDRHIPKPVEKKLTNDDARNKLVQKVKQLTGIIKM